MKILVVGSGGREHAIIWKLAQSESVSTIYSLPGNAGCGRLAQRIPGNVMNICGVADFAEKEHIDLTVVGPESPLIAGLADELERRGLRVFGPNKEAAQLEGSKVFAKQLMLQEGIPTASCEVFDDPDRASEFVRFAAGKRDTPIVVKADGEAAGKGVVVANNTDEALQAIDDIMRKKIFGKSGDRILIEEYLDGPEATFMCFVEGEQFLPMVPSQDHKRVYDGDQGPNTGGMGCYAPVPVVSPEVREQIVQNIVRPTLRALAKRGIHYKGVLYVGLALTSDGPKVVEFNCRFGDPEAQVVLPLMEGDLAELCLAISEGRMIENKVTWSDKKAVCVVMASGGYPGSYEKGKPIWGIEDAESTGALVFQAGTEIQDGKLVTSGGRVLGVTALGDSFQEAIDRAYQAVSKIHFDGAHYRRDIAQRALGAA
ncbi:MAG: phosphoribosylamine--glycine ligase [Armatimonadota bacterium]|nr:phosphoribosylamine--glycine ligase [Armatimonadota bacterium]